MRIHGVLNPNLELLLTKADSEMLLRKAGRINFIIRYAQMFCYLGVRTIVTS